MCGVLLAAGCSVAPARPSIEAYRLRQAAAKATVAKLTTGMIGAVEVKVRVTCSARVGAFSWPDGAVELTAGLVDGLDEDELAAAVAHELGHILGGRGAGAASALSGTSGAPGDVESRADRFATSLLARAGYAPDAMARTLTKVMHAPGTTPAVRARLARRIALLAAAAPGRQSDPSF